MLYFRFNYLLVIYLNLILPLFQSAKDLVSPGQAMETRPTTGSRI